MDVRPVSFRNSKKSSPIWQSARKLILTMMADQANTKSVKNVHWVSLYTDVDELIELATLRKKTQRGLFAMLFFDSPHGRCPGESSGTERLLKNKTRPNAKTGTPEHFQSAEKRNLTL